MKESIIYTLFFVHKFIFYLICFC